MNLIEGWMAFYELKESVGTAWEGMNGMVQFDVQQERKN